MNIVCLPADFADDPGWLVQAIDVGGGLARLIRRDEDHFRAASFLDDRLLADNPEARLCHLGELLQSATAMRRDDAAWIFHIGHVGSTLVSRLLGELPDVLAIREPRSLRDVALADPAQRGDLAGVLRRSLARTFRPSQRSIVKATSFVSEIAPMLVAPGARALFLFASPRHYVEGILAGENSVLELRALAADRSRRLQARGIDLAGFDRTDAHRAAAAWACEMTALEAAADQLAEHVVHWADFDAMLGDMGGALAKVAAHFGIAATEAELRSATSGPLMTRYSKALEFDYSPSLRADLLAQAGRMHHVAIDAALADLNEAGAVFPLVGRALQRVERG